MMEGPEKKENNAVVAMATAAATLKSLFQRMKTLRIALIFISMMLVSCEDSKRTAPISGSDDVVTSKKVYRCEWSPLIDPNAKDVGAALDNQNWRVSADGVCNDPDVHTNLANLISGLPAYTAQDYPFVGYCEHYLLTNGSSRGMLIGFVCENYGIVVWEMEADADGRWRKTDSGTKRGTEEDKSAIRAILSKVKFDPL